MMNLRFDIRDDLMEYNVVDFICDGEYAGTATIKAALMIRVANAIRHDPSVDFDIRDKRRGSLERGQ